MTSMGRSSLRRLAAAGALALAIALPAHERGAAACSCMGPSLAFLTPSGDAVSRNAIVRIEVPTSSAGAGAAQASSIVLREHGGAPVATRDASVPGAEVTLHQITPNDPLKADTRYEIAIVEPTKHPPTTVVGTFKTGSAIDNAPPRLDSIGAKYTHINTHFGGGDCSIRGPWITLTGVAASDPGRADAQLAFGVWQADASGKLDTKRMPDAFVFPYQNALTIGQSSLCSVHQFAFNASVVTLAVAAFDESGNASRPITFRADVTRNGP
jgi:hypothetical protein